MLCFFEGRVSVTETPSAIRNIVVENEQIIKLHKQQIRD
jgi:hypothetical protein